MRTPEAQNSAPGFIKHPDYKMLINAERVSAEIHLGCDVLARSDQALRLSENTYSDVIYFPREHVKMNSLVQSNTSSFCPFKGTACYWRLAKVTENTSESIDICWSYKEPFNEAIAIKSYIAFYKDKVTVTFCQ